jgi:hypothetical protein
MQGIVEAIAARVKRTAPEPTPDIAGLFRFFLRAYGDDMTASKASFLRFLETGHLPPQVMAVVEIDLKAGPLHSVNGVAYERSGDHVAGSAPPISD